MLATISDRKPRTLELRFMLKLPALRLVCLSNKYGFVMNTYLFSFEKLFLLILALKLIRVKPFLGPGFVAGHISYPILIKPIKRNNNFLLLLKFQNQMHCIKKIVSLQRALLNLATIHNHPQPPTTNHHFAVSTHNHQQAPTTSHILLPAPTTSHNFTATTHDQP